jgi:hypothetical protein
MSWTCSLDGESNSAYRILVGKPYGKRHMEDWEAVVAN